MSYVVHHDKIVIFKTHIEIFLVFMVALQFVLFCKLVVASFRFRPITDFTDNDI